MNNIDNQNLMVELPMYRSREGIWGKEFVWKAVENENISALLWWKTFYQNTDLVKVAKRIINQRIYHTKNDTTNSICRRYSGSSTEQKA